MYQPHKCHYAFLVLALALALVLNLCRNSDCYCAVIEAYPEL